MTTHIDQPTTDHRPANTPGTTTPGTTNQTSSPKRPLPRWVAPVGVAAALCVTGIGVLVNDANNQPEPAPTDPATETGTSQRLVQQSIDDALLEARETTAGGLPAHLEEFEAGVKVDDSYVIAEQNRFNTLRDLRVDDSFAIAEQHRFETLRDLNVDDSVVTATTPQIDVGV